MAQTKPKAEQFYGVSGNGTSGQALISNGDGTMKWGGVLNSSNVTWNTPTGQSLTYTQPTPQSSEGQVGTVFPSTTFTITAGIGVILSGTAVISGLPSGIVIASQVYNNTNSGNVLTITLGGTYPTADSLNTDLITSGLTETPNVTVSYATPIGQSLTYTTPSPQSSSAEPGSTYVSTTFTATGGAGYILSGTASFAGIPSGITTSQSYDNTNAGNTLTITLGGVFPSANSLNTIITVSGLTSILELVVNYLVVAGGGGSGTNFSGGGGAGGLRTSWPGGSGGGSGSESAITGSAATNYSLTVGGGGGLNGQGSNSIFSGITSTGGGKGAGWNQPTSVGGSGGGQGVFNPGTYFLDGAAGTSSQGYKGGGYYFNNVASAAGGGGGANQAGQHGLNPTGGYGGGGKFVNITGSNIAYGGGGGGSAMNPAGSVGGVGGVGGGGNGANDTGGTNSTNQAGTPNTGGGAGGGSRYSGQGKNGGSGIIILRYPSGYTISGLSGTTITVGTDKVTTFTTGTGNIQFN